MKKLIIVFALLLGALSVQAQSDSTAIIMMSVYEGTGLGNNNRLVISYPGSSKSDELVLLERRRLLGNQQVNQKVVAEAVNKIVLMGYKLDKFEVEASTELARRYATYIFVREEKE
jgi:hypothetical protein